jgi:hypothetical protein
MDSDGYDGPNKASLLASRADDRRKKNDQAAFRKYARGQTNQRHDFTDAMRCGAGDVVAHRAFDIAMLATRSIGKVMETLI